MPPIPTIANYWMHFYMKILKKYVFSDNMRMSDLVIAFTLLYIQLKMV